MGRGAPAGAQFPDSHGVDMHASTVLGQGRHAQGEPYMAYVRVHIMVIPCTEHVQIMFTDYRLWQVIPGQELADWIRTRTALHALPESREALRVSWKQYLVGGEASQEEQKATASSGWNDEEPDDAQ